MSSLDHWHPVVRTTELREKPIAIRLDGEEIALFRTKAGTPAALSDVCAHRRMRLSLGSVVNDRLQCPYHGWTFDAHGNGESPGTPKLHAKTGCFDVCETYGAIWVRRGGSESALPKFEIDGFRFMCMTTHEAQAPLEIVLDNFTEVEHTCTTHFLLGYSLPEMPKVTATIEGRGDTVYVKNDGPQKYVNPILAYLMGFRNGDGFVDEWTSYFSPVYTCYDQYWYDSATKKERDDHLRIYVFFNPIEACRTQIMTFVYLRSTRWGDIMSAILVKPMLRYLVNLEVGLDVKMLNNLADKSPEIYGMRLSRFDKVLGLNRARIQKVYRGQLTQSESVEPVAAE
jgi:phenylpropionate dioxygenase-like ring-hydroxylating dioxygenase large terminal subunit